MSGKGKQQDKSDQKDASRINSLIEIEKKINTAWEENKVYEINAPTDGQHHEKFMVTFPYPYMNGRLHLGHLFTMAKAEFATRYHRMLGEYSLFPFGFHCTGMPIKASADKLAMELDQGVVVTQNVDNLKSKMKSKVENISQSKILLHMGVPEEMIPEFTNPIKWLEYFPPKGEEDLKAYGSAIDWRRSFITTQVNPYYDSFIKWQFRILKKMGLVIFGKRPTICSIKDQQPCLDHDRASGEGVQPQEYTLIKLQLVDPKSVDSQFDGSLPAFLLAATLRPETMVGQTNYWYKPGVTYDVCKSADGKEFWVTGSRALRNLAAQDLIESFDPLFTIKSDSLNGVFVTHKCIQQNIRGLPLPDIKMNKGTGIVTSVPSDAPADYQGIIDLQKQPALREKYNVEESWVQIEPIKILKTEAYGDFAAKFVLDSLKSSSMKREEKLEAAKQMCYKEGFYKGEMIIGPFAGEKVITAKDKMRELMVNEGSALKYFEPENEVISRSGDECVVMLCDQWYLEYGQEDWKNKVVEHFNAKVNTYHPETREKFRKTFDWLGPWACSRQFGLGTKLPFDEKYLIDSLSDSTIYTAYYTIAHLLQGTLDGSIPGIAQVKPELINDDFFNYVFLGGPLPEGIPEETMKNFRNEFEFWYPVDCRISGKDLVTNHLTMYLYNHCAIFKPESWPIGIRANGHLKLNGDKMSKSTGNFLTAVEAMEKFSVTGVRIGLADAGDGHDDANFSDKNVFSCINRLAIFKDSLLKVPANTHEGITTFQDVLLDARISKAIIDCKEAYDNMLFRLALKIAFFDMQNYWSDYITMLDGTNETVSSTLRNRYVDAFLLMLTPIIPHFTEDVWTNVLKHNDRIIDARFPTPNPYPTDIFYVYRFLSKTVDTIKFKNRSKKGKKQENPKNAAVFIRNQFNSNQKYILSVLRENFDEKTNTIDSAAVDQKFAQDGTLPQMKTANKKEYQNCMQFLKFMQQAAPEFGKFLLNEIPEVNQQEVLEKNKQWILLQLPGVKSITFLNADSEESKSSPLWDQQQAEISQVYIPTAAVVEEQ